MITPVFEVTQNDEFITITMKVPLIKASEVDFYVFENEFKFYAKPYFLRLTFPHSVVEDGREKANFDYGSGVLTVQLPKATPGQFFPGLDMLTQLLAKKQPKTGPTIEVLNGDQEDEFEEEELDVEFEQQVAAPIAESELLSKPPYGFNNQYGMNKPLYLTLVNYFGPVMEEIADIIDLRTPDSCSAQERRELRIAHENEKFDSEHYMMDFVDDEQIQEVMHYKCFWQNHVEKRKALKPSTAQPQNNVFSFEPPSSGNNNNNTPNTNGPSLKELNPASLINLTAQKPSDFVFGQPSTESTTTTASTDLFEQELLPFTNEEKEVLIHLPRKEYLIENQRAVLVGMLDILYAYAYNHRTVMGENNVESSWTVGKISSSLSWLQPCTDVMDVVISGIRRVVCYPLFRHYQLAILVWKDVLDILKLGRRCIVKCFIDAKKIMDKSDCKYHLSRLFLDDYCVWVQTLNEKKIKWLRKQLKDSLKKVKKGDTQWNLQALEEEATQRNIDVDPQEDEAPMQL